MARISRQMLSACHGSLSRRYRSALARAPGIASEESGFNANMRPSCPQPIVIEVRLQAPTMRETATLFTMGRCLAIALLATFPGWQISSQTSNPPAFEVVDIKPADPSMMEGRKGRILPGGRIELPAITLKECIVFGYGVTENIIT